MANFKKGDRVRITAGSGLKGKSGVISDGPIHDTLGSYYSVALDNGLDEDIPEDCLAKNASADRFDPNNYLSRGVRVFIPTSGEHGIVAQIEGVGTGRIITVKTDDGRLVKWPETKVKAIVNSRVFNSSYKFGDIITWYGKKYKVLAVMGSAMKINELDATGKLKPDGDYMISVHDTHATIANSLSCNSTNHIVRKALNAVACKNSYPAAKFSKGQNVNWNGRGPWEIVGVIQEADSEDMIKYVSAPWTYSLKSPSLGRGTASENELKAANSDFYD